MIEKMKKLTMLIYHASKDSFLEKMQSIGVVDLDVNSTNQNNEVLALKDEISELQKTVKLLKTVEKQDSLKDQKEHVEYKGDIKELLEKIEIEEDKLEKIKSELEGLNKEIDAVTPWGEFDPENIEKLKNIGVILKFYSASVSKFNNFDYEDLRIEVISEQNGTVYFTVIYRDSEEIIEINANEERIPLKNINILMEEIDKKLIEESEQEKNLCNYTVYIDSLNTKILECEDQLSYMIADLSLVPEVEGKVLFITGWVPVSKEKSLIEFLNKEDIYYYIEEPKEEDKVPVLLKNGPFSRIFEPITKIYSLPEYSEIDPTPFFAPFFTMFFGLCFADFGYGLILLLISLIGLFAVKNKGLKIFAILGIFFGISTVAGGFILDTFFGAKITDFTIIPEDIKNFILFPNSEGTNGPMIFAILIGIIQVFLGLLIQTARKMRNNGFLAGLQPIGTGFILIGTSTYIIILMSGSGLANMNVGSKIPLGLWISNIPYNTYVFGGIAIFGVILVLLFNNYKKPIYIRPLTGLWELYGISSGLLGDILSYIRLFALGLAGGLLGGAFNQIAFMTKALPVPGFNYFVMILILLFGHTLNFGLSALGAFVHSLRLTFVEFYKSVDFIGGGRNYLPFKYKQIKK